MKRWIDVLPSPFNRNPGVVVVMAPTTASSRVISTKDKYELGVLEIAGRQLGLQVVYPQLATYPSHEDIFRAARIQMARPAYVGELLAIPQRLLIDEETPLVFIRDAMWRPYLHLRRYVTGLAKDKNAN